MKLENQELQDKLEGKAGHADLISPTGFGTAKNRNNAFSASKTVRHGDAKKLSMSDEIKASEEMINFLESKLEAHESNLKQKKAEYEAL